MYGDATLPWSVPGTAPGYQYRGMVLPSGTTSRSSSNGIGDPAANWTYLVMAVDTAEQELAQIGWERRTSRQTSGKAWMANRGRSRTDKRFLLTNGQR